MQCKQIKLSYLFPAAILSLGTITAVAEEKIIQQETISFEKCLKVIETSENKLSIAPAITDELDKKRIAVFQLVDGTLTITCDAEQGKVFVSTNMN